MSMETRALLLWLTFRKRPLAQRGRIFADKYNLHVPFESGVGYFLTKQDILRLRSC